MVRGTSEIFFEAAVVTRRPGGDVVIALFDNGTSSENVALLVCSGETAQALSVALAGSAQNDVE